MNLASFGSWKIHMYALFIYVDYSLATFFPSYHEDFIDMFWLTKFQFCTRAISIEPLFSFVYLDFLEQR